MKRKRFYNNKKRNRKWTEAETGRPIDFAEKYAQTDGGDNKFVKGYEKRSTALARTERARKQKRNALIAFCGVLIFLIGFISADVYIIRHAASLERFNSRAEESSYDPMAELTLNFSGQSVPAVSFDGSVMLSSVIDEAHKNGFTAVMLDAKRRDGTIGYNSTLTAVATYGVMNAQGVKPAESVKQLTENDLLPVARICTYLDNSLPERSAEMALKNGKKLYRDSEGNTYLNPESDIVYRYIKDIVTELNALGVSIMILDGCTVGETDYFDSLSQRLNADITGNVRFFEAVNVTVKGYDAESGDINSNGIKKDINDFPKLKDNQIYVISSELEKERFSSLLAKKKIYAYIID